MYLYTVEMLKIGKTHERTHPFHACIPPWGMDQWGSTLRQCHFTVRQRWGAGQVRYHLQMKCINISDEAAIAIILLFSHRKFHSVLGIQDACLTASDNRIISTLWRCQSAMTHPWNSAAWCICSNVAVDRRMTSGTTAFQSSLQKRKATILKGNCWTVFFFSASSPFTFSLVLKPKTQRHFKRFRMN